MQKTWLIYTEIAVNHFLHKTPVQSIIHWMNQWIQKEESITSNDSVAKNLYQVLKHNELCTGNLLLKQINNVKQEVINEFYQMYKKLSNKVNCKKKKL